MNDGLAKWLHKDCKTDPELAYWLPKYKEARGTIRFQDLGCMFLGIKKLAEQQDLIGWKNNYYDVIHFCLIL